MDSVMGPAISAGGRVVASIIKTKRARRKASLRIEVEAIPGDPTANVVLSLTNPRKNLDDVIVEKIQMFVRVHDESCAEPEYKSVYRGVFGGTPRLPLCIQVGQTQTWRAGFNVLEVRGQWSRHVEDAMLRTWGEEHLAQMRDVGSVRSTSNVGGGGVLARLSRVMRSIDDVGPTMKAIVKTRHDGEFESRSFHLKPDIWSRIKSAYNSDTI